MNRILEIILCAFSFAIALYRVLILKDLFRFSIFIILLNVSTPATADCIGIENPFRDDSAHKPVLVSFSKAVDIAVKAHVVGGGSQYPIKFLQADRAFNKLDGLCELAPVLQNWRNPGTATIAQSAMCAASEFVGLNANPASALKLLSPINAPIAPAYIILIPLMEETIDKILPLSKYNPFCGDIPLLSGSDLQCCYDSHNNSCINRLAPSSCGKASPPLRELEFVGMALEDDNGKLYCESPKCLSPKISSDAQEDIDLANSFDKTRAEIAASYKYHTGQTGYQYYTADQLADLMFGRGCRKAGSEMIDLSKIELTADDLITLATYRALASATSTPAGSSLGKPNYYGDTETVLSTLLEGIGEGYTGLLCDVATPPTLKAYQVGFEFLATKSIRVETNATDIEPIVLYVKWDDIGEEELMVLKSTNASVTLSEVYGKGKRRDAIARVAIISDGGYIREVAVPLDHTNIRKIPGPAKDKLTELSPEMKKLLEGLVVGKKGYVLTPELEKRLQNIFPPLDPNDVNK